MTVINMDCLLGMRSMPDNSVDSVVTDPPYGIRFMGAAWDGADIEARATARRGFASHDPNAGPNGGHKSLAAEAGKYDLAPAAMRAFQEFSEEWAREAFRVLKPGGHLLSFSSARTYHRMVCGIEDAGFEIRDQIMWIFGSGFPKSMNVANAIHAAAIGQPQGGAKPGSKNHGKFKSGCTDANETGRGFGAGPGQFMAAAGKKDDRNLVEVARQWDGWGTALKPAHEPICMARKPFAKGLTVAANVLAHGIGAINVAACRVEAEKATGWGGGGSALYEGGLSAEGGTPRPVNGRWPANLIHDGSDEVRAPFPNAAGQQDSCPRVETDKSAARFFYCAKASKKERGKGNTHPTVKPTALMRYLCRLVTPPGGIVLDPFAGSGSTGKAAKQEGFLFMGFELGAEYAAIANARIEAA
jgi:DNA modification methylase